MNERLPPQERAAASLAVIEKFTSAAPLASAPAAPPEPPRSKLAPRKTVSLAEHLGVD